MYAEPGKGAIHRAKDLRHGDVYLRLGLVDWNRAQREDILDQLGGVDDVQRALDEAGFSGLRIERFRDRLERLLQFVALSGDALELPDYTHFRTDGNVLVLDQ